MPKVPMHDVAIAGVYNTKQSRSLSEQGWSTETLVLDALHGTLNDAGLTVKDIDGIMGGGGSLGANNLVYLLGMKDAWVGMGGFDIGGLMAAAGAISNGLATTILMVGGQAAAYSDKSATAPWTRPTNEFVGWTGLFTAAEFALIARRHMHLYGTTNEQLAMVGASIRNKGHINPEAVYYGRGPFKPKDILDARMVADPFTLLMCSMTSEGGAGMIITSAERAKDLKKKPVYMLGAGLNWNGPAYTHPVSFERTGWVGEKAAKNTFAQAGLKPKDVDNCQFYDPFAFEIIRQFETYGFCGKGEGGAFVSDGKLDLGGKLPLNTDGGLMSFSHGAAVQAGQRTIEAVKQLRGEAGARQVKNAKVALTSNYGAGAFFTHTMLLGTTKAS